MKGQLYLLKHLSSTSHFNYSLTFYGDGEMRPSCERFVREHGLDDRVAFRDWTSDRAAMYADADCVVIPSDYEGLPNVMLEALLNGKRVSVRPTCTGACELLKEIGLPETWPVAKALAIPEDVWQQARQKLAELCDPARAAAEILAFMKP